MILTDQICKKGIELLYFSNGGKIGACYFLLIYIDFVDKGEEAVNLTKMYESFMVFYM
jgi:hypothetical protein